MLPDTSPQMPCADRLLERRRETFQTAPPTDPPPLCRSTPPRSPSPHPQHRSRHSTLRFHRQSASTGTPCPRRPWQWLRGRRTEMVRCARRGTTKTTAGRSASRQSRFGWIDRYDMMCVRRPGAMYEAVEPREFLFRPRDAWRCVSGAFTHLSRTSKVPSPRLSSPSTINVVDGNR